MRRAIPLVLLAACGGSGSPMTGPGGGGGGSPQVAQVRLFNDKGAEVSAHVALVVAETTRIVVGLYTPDGTEIHSFPGGVRADFTFNPDTLALAFPVDGQPLMLDVTPKVKTLAPGDPLPGGLLTVKVSFGPDFSAVETYCCFDVLVHLIPP
jgi:hypothetical protein